MDKRTNNALKTLHRKHKIKQHETQTSFKWEEKKKEIWMNINIILHKAPWEVATKCYTKPKGQSRVDNPNWQHWVHKTKKNRTKNTRQKTKRISNTDPIKNLGWTQMHAKGKHFLLLIRHPPCYSCIQSSPLTGLAMKEERKKST